MSTRIVTLFGEEIIPEPQKPAGKARAPRKKKVADSDSQEQETEDNNDAAAGNDIPATDTPPVALPVQLSEAEETITPANTHDADVIAPGEDTHTTAEQETVSEFPQEEAPAATATGSPETEEIAVETQPDEHTAPEVPAPVADAIPETLKPPAIKPAGREALLAAIRQTVHTPETPADKEVSASEPATESQEKKGRKRTAAGTSETPDNLPEDWKGEKNYYTIGEVAALFNVKTSHIRFWTNDFKLKVRTTRKGDRLYTPDQIKELRTIYHLVKERGFTLSGAKAKLKTQNKRDVTTIDLKDALTNLRGKLQILRDQL